MLNRGSNCEYTRLQNSRFFFSKSVKKSIKRGVTVLRARSSRASHARSVSPQSRSLFSSRSRPFVWLLATGTCKNTDCVAVYEYTGQRCMWGGQGAGHEYLSNGLQMQICRKTVVHHCSLPNRSPSNARPRPNVELLMRRTKLSELRPWKGRRLAQLSSSEWVWIVQHVVSVRFRWRECLKIVSHATS